MKTGAMTVLLFTLSSVSLLSTANAGIFPRGMDGRVREIRFDRAERFGREHAGREGFGRERDFRAHELHQHEGLAPEWRERAGLERAGIEREARGLRSIGTVQPLPYFTRAQSVPVVQNVRASGFTKR